MKSLPFFFTLFFLASCQSIHESELSNPESNEYKVAVKTGAKLFSNSCAVCHGEFGQGEIGPNLSDRFWIYGSGKKEIYSVISNGTENGMPNNYWRLTEDEINSLTLYVMTLKEKNGKNPEGTFYKP